MNYKEALKIMGLSDGYSADDLKRKYRELAKKYHPDAGKEKNGEMFIKINAANEILNDYLKNPDKKTSNFNSDSTYNTNQKDEVCPVCNGLKFRREKIKTPRGFAARKIPCDYCTGNGFVKK